MAQSPADACVLLTLQVQQSKQLFIIHAFAKILKHSFHFLAINFVFTIQEQEALCSR